MPSWKQSWKRFIGRCFFCREDRYDLLDAHRVFAGEEGGTYCPGNTLVLCAGCHRKVTNGYVKVHRKYMSAGFWVVNYHDEDGQERWRAEKPRLFA